MMDLMILCEYCCVLGVLFEVWSEVQILSLVWGSVKFCVICEVILVCRKLWFCYLNVDMLIVDVLLVGENKKNENVGLKWKVRFLMCWVTFGC
jgi:hypothetical protein